MEIYRINTLILMSRIITCSAVDKDKGLPVEKSVKSTGAVGLCNSGLDLMSAMISWLKVEQLSHRLMMSYAFSLPSPLSV